MLLALQVFNSSNNYIEDSFFLAYTVLCPSIAGYGIGCDLLTRIYVASVLRVKYRIAIFPALSRLAF